MEEVAHSEGTRESLSESNSRHENQHLRAKIESQKKKISPKVISKAVSHRLAVVKVKPELFKLVRIQQRNLHRRLQEIQLKYKIPDLKEPGVLKLWENLPHSVDTGNSIRKHLRENGVNTIGIEQLLHWKMEASKLYTVIENCLYQGDENKIPRIFNNSLITDYFQSSE